MVEYIVNEKPSPTRLSHLQGWLIQVASVYRDPEINRLTSAQRKTVVDHWGRFQMTEQLRSARLPAAE